MTVASSPISFRTPLAVSAISLSGARTKPRGSSTKRSVPGIVQAEVGQGAREEARPATRTTLGTSFKLHISASSSDFRVTEFGSSRATITGAPEYVPPNKNLCDGHENQPYYSGVGVSVEPPHQAYDTEQGDPHILPQSPDDQFTDLFSSQGSRLCHESSWRHEQMVFDHTAPQRSRANGYHSITSGLQV